uniref:Si:ch211-103f14.3 n=1 Tax=Neogobius melanostomus TaxID=47308 RepID=A0A8C6S482_9GOBI
MKLLWFLTVASVVAVGRSQIMSQIGLVKTDLKNLERCTKNTTNWRQLTDISVECGTSHIDLAILLCPALYTGYNESLLILNNIFSTAKCKGTLDESVTPPVVRFRFPINMTHACGSAFKVGIFSDFSNIETVNITGVVRSHDPTGGVVTYNAELSYFYSCAYPLEYLINNTRSSISIRDKNGSFISTLAMELYYDRAYTIPLVVPAEGLELRKEIYVQVKAKNLTDQYSVLMDRCYASISPLPTNSTYFNLFVPCSQDNLTTMIKNGEGHISRFSFQAFRFIEQQNEDVSTYYLHCITRLCEISTCNSFKVCKLLLILHTAIFHHTPNFYMCMYSNVPIVGGGEERSSPMERLRLPLSLNPPLSPQKSLL